jgi:hypothetical protein
MSNSTAPDCFVTIDGTRHLVMEGNIHSVLNGPVEAEVTISGAIPLPEIAASTELTFGGRGISLCIDNAVANPDRTWIKLADPAWIQMPGRSESLLVFGSGDQTVTLKAALNAWGMGCGPDKAFDAGERGFGCIFPWQLLDRQSRLSGEHFWRDSLGARIGKPGSGDPVSIEVTKWACGLRENTAKAEAAILTLAGDCLELAGLQTGRTVAIEVNQSIRSGSMSRISASTGTPSTRKRRLTAVAAVTARISSTQPLNVILDGYASSPVSAAAMLRRSAGGEYAETIKLISNDLVRAWVPVDGWAGAIEFEPLYSSTIVDRFSVRVPEIAVDLKSALITTMDHINVKSAK